MSRREDRRNIQLQAILVFVLVFLFALTLMYVVNQEQEKEEQLKATYTAESTVSRIEARLNQYLTKTDVLKHLIEAGYELDNSQFTAMARAMRDDKNMIEVIEIAKGGVVTQVYPLEGNEKAVDLNFFTNPERAKEANLAMQSGQYTVAGPFELKQGGMGVLLFDPIYVTDEHGAQQFWGFSLIVLNWERFIADMELQKLEDASYRYRIWKHNMSTGEEVTIAESEIAPVENALEVVCEVPNDTWYFEIVPKNGWTSVSQNLFSLIFTAIVALLAAMGYWQNAWRRYKDAVYTEKLGTAAQKARLANEAKTRFLFNMSHDMRTPMNAIIGFADLLEKHMDDPEKVSDYIGKIKSSSKLLLSLINYVLEMARIESGKTTLKEEVGCFPALMDSLQVIFEPTIQKKELTYVCNVEIAHDYMICDKTKLREIIFNIISNAIKYTPEGGSVFVNLTEQEAETDDEACYQIVLKDTGIGMSKDYLPHIFEEFTRERTSTESKVVGAGLGMPIVKALVELMNGTIQVESEEGKGTVFTIELTFLIAADEQIQEKNARHRTEQIESFRGKRILLAEDNDLNAEIAITILEEYGFQIERAAYGEECLQMLSEHEPGWYDLILMDIQMPHKNGYETTREIRKLQNSKALIPIIAMTANAFEEDRKKAYESGMDAYIAKPINVSVMLHTLSQILEAHSNNKKSDL